MERRYEFYVGVRYCSCHERIKFVYYIDTDEIPGFLLSLKVISSPRAVKILFFSYWCRHGY